jgi:alcohol dehydrogenase class IV
MTLKDNSSFFAQPKFLVGNRALEHIHIELDGLNVCRPMVITNKIYGKSYAKRFVRSLADSNITIGVLFDDALPYVNIHEVKRLSGLYRWRNCDSIIALGGDSVMDIAKTLNLVLNEIHVSESMKIQIPLTPLIYVATSDVDGFEVTNSLNIDGKRFYSDYLYPDVVCVDKRMVTPIVRMDKLVYSAVNSLAICIEGASSAQHNPFVDAMVFSAIRLIVDNLKIVIANKNKKNAIAGLINGIAIAGTISSNTQNDLVSMVSTIMSKEIRVSPGMISGVLLPHFLQEKIDEKLEFRDEILLSLVGINKFCTVGKDEKAGRAVDEIKSLIVILSNYFPDSLKGLSVQEHLLYSIAVRVSELSQGRISQQRCLDFLQRVY